LSVDLIEAKVLDIAGQHVILADRGMRSAIFASHIHKPFITPGALASIIADSGSTGQPMDKSYIRCII